MENLVRLWVQMHGHASEVQKQLSINEVKVSISHADNYALASAVAL